MQDDPSVTYLIIIFISFIFSAFFSGMEIAFISANKLRIELNNKTGSKKGQLLSAYVKNPSKFLSTILVGNNIAIVVYGIFIGMLLEPRFSQLFNHQYEALQLLIITIISTIIVLITAEYIPKVLFRINPDYILSTLIYPFQFFYYALLPLSWFIEKISRFVIEKILKKDTQPTDYVFSKTDLDYFVSAGEQSNNEDEHEIDTTMFKNALGFGHLQVRDCMQPRTEIVAVDEHDDIETLRTTFLENGLSKIVIYREDVDNIIGYVHQIEMFKNPKDIQSVLIPIPVTNESKLASALLKELIAKRKSIALVVDEFGVTAGIITIEDILEEIFGEIDDEYDLDDQKETEVSQDHYIFSARHEIDYLNEEYSLQIPLGDYETLGGYVIDLLGEIPTEGNKVKDNDWEYTITKVDKVKVLEIEMKKHEEE